LGALSPEGEDLDEGELPGEVAEALHEWFDEDDVESEQERAEAPDLDALEELLEGRGRHPGSFTFWAVGSTELRGGMSK